MMCVTQSSTKHCLPIRTHLTTQPLLGFRCVLHDPSSQTIFVNTARPQCVWKCLSTDDCVAVSYNHRLNSCGLIQQRCDSVESNTDFSINVYGMDRMLCFHWVPKSKYDELNAVTSIRSPDGEKKIVVARKRDSTGLYPGLYKRFGGYSIQIALADNMFVSDDHGEVLLVDPACLWAWIPYSSPAKLPVGALAAGYDVGGETLYTSRAMFDGLYSIGYYKPSKSLGYFVHKVRVNTATVMDILVIMWCLDFEVHVSFQVYTKYEW